MAGSPPVDHISGSQSITVTDLALSRFDLLPFTLLSPAVPENLLPEFRFAGCVCIQIGDRYMGSFRRCLQPTPLGAGRSGRSCRIDRNHRIRSIVSCLGSSQRRRGGRQLSTLQGLPGGLYRYARLTRHTYLAQPTTINTFATSGISEKEAIGPVVGIRPGSRFNGYLGYDRSNPHGFALCGDKPVTKTESAQTGRMGGMAFRPGRGIGKPFRLDDGPVWN